MHNSVQGELERIAPRYRRTIAENSKMLIYQDAAGEYWRVMKTFGNARYRIDVVDVPEPTQGESKIRVEDLI